MRVSTTIAATATALGIVLLSGCATTQAATPAPAAQPTETTTLLDGEPFDWARCASTAIVELSDDLHGTRTEALADALDHFRDVQAGKIHRQPAVPAERYVELLETVTLALPRAAAAAPEFTTIVIDAISDDGTYLGGVEIYASGDMEYGISAYYFADLDETCPRPATS